MRQVANKADGIGQHRFADVRDVNAAQRRVQGGEQLVRGIDLGGSDLVKER
ncbi:Uncharacterised protein [Klebsiella pneumoniae]|nr:Uncharacterised protein [Klebsiella pneumoniae]